MTHVLKILVIVCAGLVGCLLILFVSSLGFESPDAQRLMRMGLGGFLGFVLFGVWSKWVAK